MILTYETQPGTTPHKAVAWLKSQAKVTGQRTRRYSTATICDALDCDVQGFANQMAPARGAGLVNGCVIPGRGRTFWWCLGDGVPLPDEREQDPPLYQASTVAAASDAGARPGPFFPGVAATVDRGFRALLWEGKLLATGMEIRDGVAIFTQDMVQEIKRQTDWAKA